MHNRLTDRNLRNAVLAALVLAWATQALVSQLARGAEPPPVATGKTAETAVVTVAMKDAARVGGGAVTLGDVCRLSADAALPPAPDGRPLTDLVVAYRDPATSDAPAATVGVEQVIRLLADNGVGPARVRFQGPIRCDVTFADPAAANASPAQSQDDALLSWAGEAVAPKPAPAPQKPAEPAPAAPVPPADAFAVSASPASDGGVQWPTNDWSQNGPTPLSELLRRDLADRLKLPEENVELRFRDPNAAYLNRGDIDLQQVRPTRASDLGPVAWTVTLPAGSFSISADAAATVTRLTVAQPVGRGQVIRSGDVVAQPAVIRRLSERGLTLAEAVGQEAARTLAVGDVLEGDSLAPRLLVRRGQYVSVTLHQNGLDLRTLARALDDGGYGQTVKVKNDTTGEILHAVITGPQTATLVDVTGRS